MTEPKPVETQQAEDQAKKPRKNKKAEKQAPTEQELQTIEQTEMEAAVDERLNVVLVKTGDAYDASYVTRMKSMLERHLQIPHVLHCITDNPAGVDANIIKPPKLFDGWWNKLYLFSDLMPPGRLLYLDLDQVITGDITEIVEACQKHPFACYADHVGHMGAKLGTAFMTFEAGAFPFIWQDFQQNYKTVRKHPGGDQVYLDDKIPSPYFFNEDFPDAVKSYKFDLRAANLEPNDATRIVNFHGKPKPHEVDLDWVKENWG